MGDYWEQRKSLLYYQAIFRIVIVIGRNARSLIDIGSADAQYIQWFDWIKRRVRLDFEFARELEGIEQMKADFLEWQTNSVFDVALCLQVLEHVADPKTFCDRLKAISRNLVVSVPYKWPAGRHREHIHDPVDRKKLDTWMAIPPNYTLVVREPFGAARLIAYYDLVHGPSHHIDRSEARRLVRQSERGRGSPYTTPRSRAARSDHCVNSVRRPSHCALLV